jgi:putative endonuclease
MFNVYILKSLKDNGIYVGKTSNFQRRFCEHNSGQVQSTKSRRPFIVLEIIQCSSEIEARKLEKEYKKGYKREEIKRKHNLI